MLNQFLENVAAIPGLQLRSLLVAGALGVFLVPLILKLKKTKELPLPPQPPGDFLLGNLRQVVTASQQSLQHLLICQWAREYGEIFRVRLGPVTEYFLNSDHAVKEIMDRGSAHTSERPRWIVSNEQICNRLNVLLLHGSDPRWKHQRKVLNSLLTSIPRADAGLPFLHYETAKFLHYFANNAEEGRSSSAIQRALARYTYSTFSSQIFGMDIPEVDNDVIGYIHETGLAQILGTIPGMYMVDIFTWMEFLPIWLKPWEKEAKKRFQRDMRWCLERLQRIKSPGFLNSYVSQAFLPSVVQTHDHYGFASEEEAAYLSLQLIIGAADTSQISTWSFLEAMLQNPEAQRKCRIEIDNIVGDRLPEFADLDRIPYVKCIMKEVWRWRPPVALGHPHVTTRDIIYNGYRIPKGSRIHLNSWAIGHDPRRHDDPERFWPERYIGDETTAMQSINSADVSKRDHFAFGAGRRICPGYNVAERSFAVAIMRILWAFEVQPAPGTQVPLDPLSYMKNAEMPGNASINLPVTLEVRSEERKKLINDIFDKMDRERTKMEPL